MNLFVPEIINLNQTIFQKQDVIDGFSKGFSLILSKSIDTTQAKIKFLVGSGSIQSEVSCYIEKGTFNNLAFICDSENNRLSIFKNGIEVSKSSKINKFSDLYVDKNFLIAYSECPSLKCDCYEK